MQLNRFFLTAIFWFAAMPFATTFAQTPNADLPTVKVFWLAGQSNMQGQGVVDLDHPDHYNGGRGTLKRWSETPEGKSALMNTLNRNGEWVTRDDVFVRYETEHGIKKGGLTVGFTGYEGRHHIGPEFQFGHVMGEHFDEPVLIIKTAWGGKSLSKDFRPPSAGGRLGKYYQKMIQEYRQAIEAVSTDFPELKNHRLELSGFVWFQGWNDMVDEAARAEYENNLACLIRDLRTELKQPELPFLVGELGNEGNDVNEVMKSFRLSQLKATGQAAFTGNVKFVRTSQFARPKEQSPNVGHGHHWFGNAESYFLIGGALGNSMIELLRQKAQPKVLILGDSISIGYTSTVKIRLSEEAFVCRPTNLRGGAENCAGTTNGVKGIQRWLKIGSCKWDVIHFNFGLHDLKHVDPETRKNSQKESDPPQADLETYARQLREIVDALEATGAKLIFATTTPVPEGGVRPFRDPASVAKYNQVAVELMEQRGIVVNDLYTFANERLEEIQQPVNVHFHRKGSELLGEEVVKAIREALAKVE